QVTALKYKDRVTDEEHTVELAGIFVQIGLLPNTDFLKATAVELSNRGEILINERNETNVKGVFAAGDCTTVPYKQIIIATGEGGKAQLSEFNNIIRPGHKKKPPGSPKPWCSISIIFVIPFYRNSGR